jgi:hypothetical protein
MARMALHHKGVSNRQQRTVARFAVAVARGRCYDTRSSLNLGKLGK